MNKSTITRLNNKHDVSIFNVTRFSGAYKMSFSMHTNYGTFQNIVVKRSETISEVIEKVLN
ncbi:hypothetical protein [Paraburkholderia fungorum]|uniref:hypothetical protein n=1 Tax=Paraburkholderia TaxID=1822464 RepID=UPI000D4AFACA|nr:hypothetical protein [Paraburkholderia fungorum]PRZ45375.1 hypothetical protein BX589_13954 [Paraburkholderia fungorum]